MVVYNFVSIIFHQPVLKYGYNGLDHFPSKKNFENTEQVMINQSNVFFSRYTVL